MNLRVLLVALLLAPMLAGCTAPASSADANTARLTVEWGFAGDMADDPTFRFKLVSENRSVEWNWKTSRPFAEESHQAQAGAWTLRAEAWNAGGATETCETPMTQQAGDRVHVEYVWDGEPGIGYKGPGDSEYTIC